MGMVLFRMVYCLLFGLLLLGSTRNSLAQIGPINAADFNVDVVKVDTPPRLDGILDDPVWKQAQMVTNLLQHEPAEGEPATLKTEIRVLYDEDKIYFGFMCYDPEPDKINARELKRDGQLWQRNDMVSVAVATFEDMRDAYYFQTNPQGARRDMLVGQEGANLNGDWNAIWEAKGSIHDLGWSVEIAIPFKSFRFPNKEEQVWGVNFSRHILRAREDAYWVPISRKDGFQGMFKFGKGGRLRGLRNIKPGRSVEVLPYTVLGSLGERQTISTTPVATDLDFDMLRDLGGDVKWGITSNLTGDFTINPDFAQIEADDQIINLTRFEFQFNEKRPFFLEGSDIFNLGRSSSQFGGGGGGGGRRPPGGNMPQLFFSRRIGRQLADGTRVPVDLGTKITGKVGGTNLGYLNMQTRETAFIDDGLLEIEPETNWHALRLRHGILNRSSIGVIGTFKEPESTPDGDVSIPLPRFSKNGYNRVVGVDGSFAFVNTRHEFQFAGAQSWTDGKSGGLGKESLWYLNQSWRNQNFNYQLSYTDIGKNFEGSKMGFILRKDIRSPRAAVGFTPLIRKYGIRSISLGTNYEYYANHQTGFSNPESWRYQNFGTITLEEGTTFFLSHTINFDTLDKTTKITGVHFPQGEYRFNRSTTGFFTNTGKRLSATLFASQGSQYGADLKSINLTTVLKPTDRLSTEWNINWNRVERADRIGLAATEFDFNETMINRLRVNYSFTTELFLTTLVQINSDKRAKNKGYHLNTIIANVLLAYRMDSGHTFFLAFNQFSDDNPDDPGYDPFNPFSLTSASQTVVAKFSYLLNL